MIVTNNFYRKKDIIAVRIFINSDEVDTMFLLANKYRIHTLLDTYHKMNCRPTQKYRLVLRHFSNLYAIKPSEGTKTYSAITVNFV